MKTSTLIKLIILLSATQTSVSAQATQGFVKDEIVVAIIDTGIDLDHPFLKDNLWINPQEINNGKDNDGNGFAGDIHGWNFASNNNDLTDNHGHGTHIAGIIRQKAENTKVKFMILKYFDPLAPEGDNLVNSVKAIRYATKMKVDIINYSGGGDHKSLMEEQAIREAQGSGILIVAAAGNNGRNTDEEGYYPANYEIDNLISVGATDFQQRRLPSSNHGPRTVHTMAPGKDIYSTLPGGKYGYMTGTSQATAWVSGELVRFLSGNSTLSEASTMKKQFLTSREQLSARIAQNP